MENSASFFRKSLVAFLRFSTGNTPTHDRTHPNYNPTALESTLPAQISFSSIREQRTLLGRCTSKDRASGSRISQLISISEMTLKQVFLQREEDF